MRTASTPNITHSQLCIATAKRFNEKVALYEYKSFASLEEEPDVLVFSGKGSMLFEIKVSISDFKADQNKECRKKVRLPYWIQGLAYSADKIIAARNRLAVETAKRGEENAVRFNFIRGKPEVALIEREHLGSRRYFVCPYGLIPVEKLPEGWGLYYYKNEKFYLKKESGKFRPNLWIENALAVHALRRFASGDDTGILIKTYETDKERRIGNESRILSQF